MHYLSTFVSGCEQEVVNFLRQDVRDVKIIKIMDGAVLYNTDKDITTIQNIRYFNNSFIVLKTFRNISGGNRIIINNMISELVNDFSNIKLPKYNIKIFKLFTSVENKLISHGGKLTSQLIDKIKTLTKKQYDNLRADTEFWLIYRSEQIGFFMLRITENKKKLMRGELRPEIANILCRLSNPKEDDVFCDPFCGSGSIPLERSKMCGYRGIFALDNDADVISSLKEKTKKIKNSKFQKSFFIKKQDFFHNSFDDNFLDVVVSDPPWGYFQKIDNNFYDLLFAELARILKPGGRLVLLTALKDKMQNNFQNFKLHKHYDILLSGQKAGIFVFKKI